MPDILLVGFDDVSAAECGPGVCPNLATFRATAFETQAFSHPVCSQSRAAILFGSYGKKIGTWKDIGALEPTTTTPLLSLPTMPGALQAAGYQTALVGKWHCGPHTEGAHWALAPLERGYESWLAGTRLNLNSSPSQDYRDWQRADADVLGFLVTEHESRYATLAQLEEAQAWWTITPGPKRFLHVALNAPHGPLHSDMPDELLAGWPRPDPLASNRTKYLAMLRTADTAFGRLLDMVGPETAVFLYSDNGTSKQSAAASVNPDHTKETTFDPGTRVLTLGRWGNCPVGFFSVLTHLVDLGAGVLAVAGVTPPTSWDSKTMGRTYVLSEAELSDGIVDRAARTQTHKLRQVTSESGVLEELYDLVVDPLEEAPLDLEAAENQAALLYLRAKLDAAAL